MLQQFTWTDFLVAAVPLVLAWYAWLFLVYGRGRRPLMIGRQASFSGLGADRGSDNLDSDGARHFGTGIGSEFEPRMQDDLMGKPRMPEGMARVSTSDVVFVDHSQRDLDEPGLVVDVIEEIRELFGVLAKEDGTKQDFFRLIAAVKQAYPGVGSHPGIGEINAFVVAHAPFLISVQELESLWD